MSAIFDPARDINLHVLGRIKQEDAERQMHTAVEVAARLKQQPGLILADEVGMGKTYVALASAATIHFTDPERRPIVIMVPSSLAEKWPRDAEVFRNNCLSGSWKEEFRFPEDPITSGTDFLKTLEYENRRRRNAVVFVTHGALHRSLSDGWIRLAILRRSMYGRHGSTELRTAIGRFAGELLRMKNAVDESAWDGLLSRDPADWLRYLQRNYPETAEQLGGDDPVPAHLWAALDDDIFIDELREVYDCLTQFPRRDSKHLGDRITELRHKLKGHIENVWTLLKGRIGVRLPLLIFDEAHHLKNPGTQLVRSLFRGSGEDAAEIANKGAFFGVFEKMLMLTATPFQLGHHELLNVLRLFNSVAWEKQGDGIGRDKFTAMIDNLGLSLDAAQSAALRLDQTWARLKLEDLVVDEVVHATEDSWWDALQNASVITPSARAAKEQAEATGVAMKTAEAALRPWVLRHLRARKFLHANISVMRRRVLPGEGIRNVEQITRGLPVDGSALLPFLLSARTVALQPGKRAVFAEGLASSYEAFLYTHKNRQNGSDQDDEETKELETDDRLQWYGDEIHRSLKLSPEEIIEQEHPKLDATADKALELWKRGEKVVIFCHYIQTGLALRRAVSKRVWKEIHNLAAEKMKEASETEVERRLETLGQSIFKEDNLIRKRFDAVATQLVREVGTKLEPKDIALVVEVMRRFFRTPSFLARFFPLDHEARPEDVDAAFQVKDGSDETLRDILSRFVKFIEGRETDERGDYLAALDRIQTGTQKASAADALDGEVAVSQGEHWLPNVRLVNGSTKMEARRALMLTFNTPFYPEILIASAVLAEGVDLHLNCRYIIHHDLCWNPSTIEQRTGRVDRIGAKVEKCGISIDIFMPYVAGTQDEKMYRVVMDRERWFKVVMGEKLKNDAASVEAMAARIPMPEKLALKLAFNLGIASDVEPLQPCSTESGSINHELI